jgi:hypothetical protein
MEEELRKMSNGEIGVNLEHVFFMPMEPLQKKLNIRHYAQLYINKATSDQSYKVPRITTTKTTTLRTGPTRRNKIRILQTPRSSETETHADQGRGVRHTNGGEGLHQLQTRTDNNTEQPVHLQRGPLPSRPGLRAPYRQAMELPP